MGIRTYNKYVYYLKSTGTCIVIAGVSWFFYQLRETSQVLRSAVATNALNLEQPHAQYIYIDDPRYKDIFTYRSNKDLHSSTKDNLPKLNEKIMKWWKSLNRRLAYRLLYMAKHGDKNERYKAVYSLGNLKHLKDWHYRQLAQMLDAQTAVALARLPNIDLRFFLQPPYYYAQCKLHDVIEEFHHLLLRLNAMCKNSHPCLPKFLNEKFKDTQRDGVMFDHDLANVGMVTTPAIVWDQELLQNCIQAIYHHSSLEEYSRDLVAAGGLPILMNIQKIFSKNVDVCILLAKILSNISLHSDHLVDIFRSGWVGILASWAQNKDIRLSAPANRALANLDMNDYDHVKYPRRIYLLHPLHRYHAATKLDVVFLHGLLGGVFVTWRQRDPEISSHGFADSSGGNGNDILPSVIDEQPQEFLKDLAHDIKMREWNRLGEDYEVILDDCPVNTKRNACGPYTCKGDDGCMRKREKDALRQTQCWPKDWLPEDIPYLRVIGVNYDTNLSLWTPLCPIESTRSTMSERSNEYLTKLMMAGVGKRPVVWVCHSMGGLLVKKMLVEEWKNGDKHNVCKNTRSIVFYSTPHRGTHVADLRQTTQMLVWPSVEVRELRQESPELLKLHEEFLDMLKHYPIEVVSFSETKSTLVTALKFRFQFVSPHSADPGVGEFYEIPQDHLSICKPANRHSFLYQKLISVIRRNIGTSEKSKVSTITNFFSLPRLF